MKTFSQAKLDRLAAETANEENRCNLSGICPLDDAAWMRAADAECAYRVEHRREGFRDMITHGDF